MASDDINWGQRGWWALIGVGILLLFAWLSHSLQQRPPPGAPAAPGAADALPTTLTATTPGLDPTAKAMAAAGCYTCHQPARRFIGPSWREIAQQYAGDPTVVPALAEKVRMGGGGVWGSVPMGPHPDVDEVQATTMVRYILAQTAPAAAPGSAAVPASTAP